MKIGLVLAGIHLAFSVFVWLVVCRGGGEGDEGWIYVAFLHLPTLGITSWLFPGIPGILAGLPQPLVYCGFGTVLWFIFGWTASRLVALY